MYLLRMFREHEWGSSNKIIWFSHEIFNSKHDFLSERYHRLYRCLQGYRGNCKVVKYQFWLLILKLNNSNFTLLLVTVETNKKLSQSHSCELIQTWGNELLPSFGWQDLFMPELSQALKSKVDRDIHYLLILYPLKRKYYDKCAHSTLTLYKILHFF